MNDESYLAPKALDGAVGDFSAAKLDYKFSWRSLAYERMEESIAYNSYLAYGTFLSFVQAQVSQVKSVRNKSQFTVFVVY